MRSGRIKRFARTSEPWGYRREFFRFSQFMSFIPRSRGDTFVKREWLLSDRIDNYFSRVVEIFILHFDSSGFCSREEE